MKVTKPVTGSLVERGGYYHTLINAYVNGKRKIISRTTGLPVKNNYRRALKILEDRKQEYDESGLSGMLTMEERRRNTSLLLSEYMSKFVERKKDKISPVTYEGYTNMIKGRIRRFFDPLGVTIGSLTPQLIEDFLNTVARRRLQQFHPAALLPDHRLLPEKRREKGSHRPKPHREGGQAQAGQVYRGLLLQG